MKNVINCGKPEYVPETIDPSSIATGDLFDVYKDQWQKSGNLLVKIQAIIRFEDRSDGGDTIPDPDRDLFVYNEDRNFQCLLDPKKLDAKEFISILREKGIGSTTGYFWAFLEKDKPDLVVITDPILPAQSW